MDKIYLIRHRWTLDALYASYDKSLVEKILNKYKYFHKRKCEDDIYIEEVDIEKEREELFLLNDEFNVMGIDFNCNDMEICSDKYIRCTVDEMMDKIQED